LIKPLAVRSLVLTITLWTSVGMTQNGADAAPIEVTHQPRQVILIIGDGMDEQQLTIARNYLKGSQGKLQLDHLPFRASMQILTTEDRVNGKPVYVADSANTATSMATGAITSRGRISTSAGTDANIATIMELAVAGGLRTGLVTTSSITDATPASFITHINFRLCENPDAMVDVNYKGIALGDCSEYLKANGGGGSIAEQLADSPVDVLLGGGEKHFTPIAEAETISVKALAERNGFEVITRKDELASASQDKRLLGVFAQSTLPVRLRGEDGRKAEEPEPSLLNYVHPYLGDVTLPAPMVCEANPDFANMPSLQQMTNVALDRLSRNNNKGFFLMIESASIDKQSHERKPCGSIGEVEQLDEALQSALAFAETHPRTLILVTADHSQAAQLIPDESLFAAYPISTYTPGYVARIVTPEGSHMAINYATSNFMLEEHTGAAVPLLANSEGIGRIPAFVQQPQIFGIIREYLGI
jgi:alkaline phosphatase